MVQITSEPSAHITVNRNRIKSYGDKCYLGDGAQYEIELWNPLQHKILAEIEIDGKKISSAGIIINPGQRIYLERWIDEPKKFLFSTYHAEDSLEGRNATSNNGKVKVSFFYENLITWSPSPYYIYGTPNTNIYTNTPFAGTTVNSVYTVNVNNSSFSCSTAGSLETKTTYSENEKLFETGISSKGDTSNQSFTTTHGDFYAWPSRVVEVQILPASNKPVEADKIRQYCTECGTRIRANSWKFCPSCGEKL